MVDAVADADGGVEVAPQVLVCPPLYNTACGMASEMPGSACPTYADVQTWCAQGRAIGEEINPCDDLFVVTVVTGIDSAALYYFDSVTTQLIGLALEGAQAIPSCIGGTPGFDAARAFARCPTSTTIGFGDAGVCATLPGLDAGVSAAGDAIAEATTDAATDTADGAD